MWPTRKLGTEPARTREIGNTPNLTPGGIEREPSYQPHPHPATAGSAPLRCQHQLPRKPGLRRRTSRHSGLPGRPLGRTPSGPGRQSNATSRISTNHVGRTRPAPGPGTSGEAYLIDLEERLQAARLEPPPAHPQLPGWTRLSTIVSKIEWMAQQLEEFYNAVKTSTDPFVHIAAVAAYEEAMSNGRRH